MPSHHRFIIVPGLSHTHGLGLYVLKHLEEKFMHKDGFFIETITLPPSFVELDDALYGPINGDAPVAENEVYYAKRGERNYDSRLINKPVRKTNKLTVIAGPHKNGDDEYACVLYTAFGGPLSPKELLDPFLKEEEKKKSADFWAEHALAQPRD